MFELIYTSVPQGLLQGRSGFSTVAMTEGFPPNLIPQVENLSGYSYLFPPENEAYPFNPVNYTYFRMQFGIQEYGVISKISAKGLSYTGRSNHLAVHLLFSPKELGSLPGSPARILQAEDNFVWDGEVALLPVNRHPRLAPDCEKKGTTWEKLLGNGDWARVMAEKFRKERNKPVCLAFNPQEVSSNELLALMAEVSAWLTPEELQNFTFSTYSYQSAIGNPAFLRAYPQTSPYLGSFRRLNPDSVFDLNTRPEIPEAYQKHPEAILVTPQIPSTPEPVLPPELSSPSHEAPGIPQAPLPDEPAPRKSPWIFCACALVVFAGLFLAIYLGQSRRKSQAEPFSPHPATSGEAVEQPLTVTPVPDAPQHLPPSEESVPEVTQKIEEPQTIEQWMEELVGKKSPQAPIPKGWAAFLESHAGEFRLADETCLTYHYTPSKYVIAMWEGKKISQISIQVYRWPVNIKLLGGIAWNRFYMKIDGGWGKMLHALEEYNQHPETNSPAQKMMEKHYPKLYEKLKEEFAQEKAITIEVLPEDCRENPQIHFQKAGK